jgi:ubiquinol-cytochrome c reductase cytochrome c1 subunit
MKKILLLMVLLTQGAWAAGGHIEIPQFQDWTFDGPLGHFDQQQLQRGFKVYKEVCATCHALGLKSYRNLNDLGFNEAQIKRIASEYEVLDGPNDDGEMFKRPATPADRFVPPYANEKAARAANNGAYPLDLSLITKARPDGSNYLRALLTGYSAAPADMVMNDGMYYNKYFTGHQIAMPPPLSDGLVEYPDGSPATVQQYAADVAAFLTWTAEPKLEQRKKLGLKVMIFLVFTTVLLYLLKQKVWRDVH